MRDKLVHDYNKVDLELTWEVTQSIIPELLKFVLPFLPQNEIERNWKWNFIVLLPNITASAIAQQKIW